MTLERFNVRIRRAPVCRALLSILAILLAATSVLAQGGGPIVSKIEIAGNQRVEDDAIRIHITQQPGQPLDQTAVDNDLKSIFKMGFFEPGGVTATVENRGGQNVLVYHVKERPQISDVRFYGMKAIRSNDDKIVAATKIHPGAILDPVAVKETINGITQVYNDKGYVDAQVTFKQIPQPDNTAFAEFDVKEGSKVEITKIEFRGNKAFSARLLRANIETKEYSRFVSWFTGWGALDQRKVQEDVDRLTAFYYDNGYLNVHVS
ncbi:MAG: bamA, partial [Candidatus Binatus sp.]|nr:bamA [Candidatus Binatus sp.]